MKNKKNYITILLLAASALFAVNLQARGPMEGKGPDFDVPVGPPGDTIVEIALGNENFSTLVEAVVKADLVDALNGLRQYTVFAPTNAAFEAAAEAILGMGATGPELVAELDEETLTTILLYHVAPGERFSDAVLASEEIFTLARDFIYVDGTTLVGNNSSANLIVELVNIDASNGVIHAIDFVLLP